VLFDRCGDNGHEFEFARASYIPDMPSLSDKDYSDARRNPSGAFLFQQSSSRQKKASPVRLREAEGLRGYTRQQRSTLAAFEYLT